MWQTLAIVMGSTRPTADCRVLEQMKLKQKKHIDSRKLSIENRIVRIILLFSVQNSKKTSKMTFENIERMSRLLRRTENFFIGDKI